MELTLHVGLKKTATSTLQHVLNRSKADLLAQGLVVPCTTEQHHRVARRVRMRPVESRYAVRQALAPILADLREAAVGKALLSSEHLVSCPETGLRELRDMLQAGLPGVRLRVLAYVREPVGFATSMCQQNLKNGNLRLADFHADPWRFPVGEWLRTLIAVFGREAVTVRPFDLAELVQGNIVADVLSAIGMAEARVAGEVPHLNAALSLEAVMVADALIGLRPSLQRDRKRRNEYRRPLSRIEGGRFALPVDVQDEVIAGSAADMAWLKAEFGLTIVPRPVPPPGEPLISPAEAEALAREILRAAER